MRRWLVFFCIFFLILSFIFYCILSINSESENEVDVYIYEHPEESEVIIYEEIKSGKNVKIYRSDVEEVLDIDLNDYLRGVVASEMPADYSLEALKAQAIVARTFLFKRKEEGHVYDVDICSSSDHCQAYSDKEEIFRLWRNLKMWDDEYCLDMWNRINTAVLLTDNLVIKYDGKYIDAFFHASSPVRTENSYEIWGKEYIPYLVSVESVESEEYKYRHSSLDVENSYFEDKIRELYDPSFELGNSSVEINSYTDSGRVRDILVGNKTIPAEELRKIFGLKSTMFTIESLEGGMRFNVVGYGHGIGMSQVGADYLARQGKNYEEIITHYYTRSSN